MKLQQLRYLVAIVDNGLNITAASEKLFTSQPGVSKQVRLLEEELSLQLFVRKGKSLAALTDAGHQVVERARRIISETQNIKSLSSELSGEQKGELVIATTPTQARYVLPDMLESFQRRNQGVSLRLNQGTSEQIAEQVQSREADFAIASGESELFEDLVTVPIYSWERIILVPRGHPLAKLALPALADIVRYPIISYTYSFSDESSLAHVFNQAGVEPNVVFTAQDPDIIKDYVRRGMGIGILACMAYNPELDHDLVAINTKDLFPTLTTWVGFRKDRFLSQYMFDFLEKVAPGTTRQEIEQALLGGNTDTNVVPFPGPKPVQDHPTFGEQSGNCCGGVSI
ncbi:MAG: LysR family cys regulon transcriptional activator [Lysobacterales bacterium]|jgi:LysR family cys regulon transcriptional activator